ncbi:MAG: DUF5063 domain-containing protein [Phycicoccus sp.]|nr:DUF5063 domain-containing protein [Phycicoccus sp.]
MPDDVLHVLAEDCGRDAEMFVDTITSVATGEQPEAALPLCLLALAQVQLMGARLGAMEDVVLDERFEADAGPDAEIEELRDGLALMFAGLDEYADVTDPMTDPTPTTGSLSGDLTEIASSLAHGHAHLVAGRITEALWWWQFDYLADWGERAAAAMRAIHALVAHVRLDIDPDVVAEAEFDALHP